MVYCLCTKQTPQLDPTTVRLGLNSIWQPSGNHVRIGQVSGFFPCFVDLLQTRLNIPQEVNIVSIEKVGGLMVL